MWGGEVAGITGAGGTFTVTMYQYPKDRNVGSPGTVASGPLGSPAGGSAGSSGGFETYGTARKYRKFSL